MILNITIADPTIALGLSQGASQGVGVVGGVLSPAGHLLLTLSSGTVLDVGSFVSQAGPGGGAGSEFAYTQAMPSAAWTIVHGLGKHPAIEITDTAGHRVEGDVQYVDLNTVLITFAGAFSGAAYLS